MKRRLALASLLAVIVAAGALFASSNTASAATFSTDTPVAVTCTSTGQVCNQSYTATATTSFQLTLAFQSAFNGCANFSVAFFVDGQQVFSSPVLAPFTSTGVIDLSPVAAGPHALEVRATGVPGGCNTGTLASWAGRFAVTTNDDPPPTPDPEPEPDPGPDPEPDPGPIPGGPTSARDCKDGAWRTFSDPSFKNLAECLKFAAWKRYCETASGDEAREAAVRGKLCKPDKPGKPEKPGKPGKDDKHDKDDKSGKHDKPTKPDKPGKHDGRG